MTATVTPLTIKSKEQDYMSFFDEETLNVLNGVNDVKTKKEEHEYRMILFKDYTHLKENGMTDERIVFLFGNNMKQFCENLM